MLAFFPIYCNTSIPESGVSMSLLDERFWNKVEKTDGGCWEWQGYKNYDGYGCFKLEGKVKHSHRLAYEELVGTIPEGLYVLHHCDNPSCVNPNHLFLGTNQDNMTDMVKKGRQSRLKGEKHGRAKLAEEDVIEIRRRVSVGKHGIQTKLGKEFNVSQTLISKIANRQRWTHLKE